MMLITDFSMKVKGKTNPPIPHEVGSVTFKAADTATAASAVPPSEAWVTHW